MTIRTVTGLYDTYDAAAQTVCDLEAAQIPHDEISMVAHRSDTREYPVSLSTGLRRAPELARRLVPHLVEAPVCLPGLGCSPFPASGRWWPRVGWLPQRSAPWQVRQRVAPLVA
jgi:hypothetical protein